MRSAFEAWAQRDGHIVRRREDKPDEYLVYETQRRWMIWQAALSHGAQAAEAPRFVAKAPVGPEEAALRERVLNEVLDAINTLDEGAGLAGARKVILNLRTRQRALATEKA
ncbi:hypothetical protein NX773_11090 [Massilia solisilvae]|uniref:Integrase n=1 Tax=Massilia solisilvae TaxID=1811225 RepID=A0ABT2BJM0_9BURK|nr:hypothetical protein [Massilia solisilvae]MCS0608709.1 hypothetical protein [Massilia solisilvae]